MRFLDSATPYILLVFSAAFLSASGFVIGSLIADYSLHGFTQVTTAGISVAGFGFLLSAYFAAMGWEELNIG